MSSKLSTKQTELAVITPLHNESENIRYFYDRLRSTHDGIDDLSSWEVLFINDGSNDNSLEELMELRKQDKRVNIISLSRSFGYQRALQAGLRATNSQLYAIIDVDCEDPPELLKEFYDSIKQDYVELAYGIRSNRKEPKWIKFFRGLFYKINRAIGDSDVILWMAEFSMFTHNVKSVILSSRNNFPFLRTELAYTGLKRKGFDYLRDKRKFGSTHYSFIRMTMFAVAGFLASSTFPLRLILYSGALIGIVLPLIWIVFGLSLEVASHVFIVIVLYYFILSLSMIAIYLARTYHNIIYRPLYVIDPRKTFLNIEMEN